LGDSGITDSTTKAGGEPILFQIQTNSNFKGTAAIALDQVKAIAE
jgi:hypothetical protein